MSSAPVWDGQPRGQVSAVSLVRAAILFGLGVVASSEALGALDAFSRGPVVGVWSVGAIIVAIFVAGTLWSRERPLAGLLPRLPSDPVTRVSVACIVIVLVACLVAALLGPPNNWDVLSYHQPRVRHWIQNRHLGHYPSHVLRQLSYPPAASYFVAQLHLLTGNDRLANLPQWLAFVGCIGLTPALTLRLAGRRAVLPATVACATAPMAIMQASHAQTDLVAAFWLLCFVYLVFTRARYRVGDVLYLGAALGLGLATKPTLLLFAPPFLAILTLRAARRGWRAAVLVSTAVLLVAVLPCLPFAVRNHRTFGRPLGPDMAVSLSRKDPATLASNLLRHVALSYPFRPLWRGIVWVHDHVLHVAASDPATTIAATKFDPEFAPALFDPDENLVASPVHVSIALGAAAVALGRWRRRGRAALRLQLAVALGLGFLGYCFAMRWQPWANRLWLPLVLLASPLIGCALAAATAALRTGTICLLVGVGVLLSLTNVRHPLVGSPSIFTQTRDELYFASYLPEARATYDDLGAKAREKGCARVGLIGDEKTTEHLLWVTLERYQSPAQIRHVEVTNPSGVTPPEPLPDPSCGVVTIQKMMVRGAAFW